MYLDHATEPAKALAQFLAKLDFERGALVTDESHHQGEVRRFCPNHPALPEHLIIKRPKGRGLRGWLSRQTLQRECQAYERLSGVPGIPKCFGFHEDQYLVLEYIDGQPISDRHEVSPMAWAGLLQTIQAMHDQGVAHGDLKKKDNLLITPAGKIYVIDLGTAVIRHLSWHPLNRALFRFIAQTDLNAWIKHKYQGYDGVCDEDKPYLKRSWLERMLTHWRSLNR